MGSRSDIESADKEAKDTSSTADSDTVEARILVLLIFCRIVR